MIDIVCLLALGAASPLAAQPQERAGAAISTRVDVQPKELLAAAPSANWPMYHGDYSGRRYSALDQINAANVAQLRAQWVFHAPGAGEWEVTPVVVDGIMFVGAANDVYAIDARTGQEIWHYARPISEGLIDDASQHHNRGVGVWHSHVFIETDNAHLLCLDARSGNLLWDVPYAEGNKNYGATSAPLVINGKVLVGTSGGDDGVRGFLAAFDAETGKPLWRFWTIPAPGEPGSQSWPGKSYLHAGGTTWMPGTYDPELGILYWGTSNPSPDFDGAVRPGDDLYTDSVVALDADTGKPKWYFQFTPHDLYDYDAVETPVLVDAEFHGRPRKLLVQADRNGFLYVLDRVTGKFLSATPFAQKLNWASSIDAQGKPIRTGVEPSAAGTLVCPGYAGATNWNAPSFNPATHLFYFMALEDCSTYFLKPQEFTEGRTYYSTGVKHPADQHGHRTLMAFDLQSGKFRWSDVQAGTGRSMSGTMTTAGGLVFFGDDAQSVEAVDAVTGASLWHFHTGQTMHASPMTYAVDGKQYVAIASGGDLFSFALP